LVGGHFDPDTYDIELVHTATLGRARDVWVVGPGTGDRSALGETARSGQAHPERGLHQRRVQPDREPGELLRAGLRVRPGLRVAMPPERCDHLVDETGFAVGRRLHHTQMPWLDPEPPQLGDQRRHRGRLGVVDAVLEGHDEPVGLPLLELRLTDARGRQQLGPADPGDRGTVRGLQDVLPVPLPGSGSAVVRSPGDPEYDAYVRDAYVDAIDQLRAGGFERVLWVLCPHQSLDVGVGDLSQEFRDGLICPVLLGSARDNHGIFRLLKALRHEAPTVDVTARRLKLENAKSAAYVMKSLHTAHGGKLSLVRVLTGEFGDGTVVSGADGRDERAAGVFSMRGEEPVKRGTGKAGDTVALGRLENIKSGETIGVEKGGVVQVKGPTAPPAVFATGLGLKDRKDEVKLTSALAKLIEDDPSLRVEMNTDTHQMLLLGQGEMHLRVSVERLQRKYGVAVERQARLVPYKETIRAGTQVRGRHKKQSGGHGQFGDVVLEIQPRPRGAGFEFAEKITGGVVPRQFIPSVEIGVKDYLQHGPLGFPVVDVAVTLLDGSYHTVDSSDMAFRQAARIGMTDGLPKCSPVLLEPVMAVEICVPSEATARINAIIAQRRGQILGFDSREGWTGWDVVQAQMPASEMESLIVDLRSATSGVGTYTSRFDHLAELTGRLADQVLAAHRQAAE